MKSTDFLVQHIQIQTKLNFHKWKLRPNYRSALCRQNNSKQLVLLKRNYEKTKLKLKDNLHVEEPGSTQASAVERTLVARRSATLVTPAQAMSPDVHTC